jgi:hypothetical protein
MKINSESVCFDNGVTRSKGEFDNLVEYLATTFPECIIPAAPLLDEESCKLFLHRLTSQFGTNSMLQEFLNSHFAVLYCNPVPTADSYPQASLFVIQIQSNRTCYIVCGLQISISANYGCVNVHWGQERTVTKV